MHKFFCSFNKLTERYELGKTQGLMFGGKVNIQAENTLLPQIKNNIQSLYEQIVLLKEGQNDDSKLTILDETELLISNLYYSLFASPLELTEKKTGELTTDKAIELALLLERDINIPEYNRLIVLIKNNLQRLQ